MGKDEQKEKYRHLAELLTKVETNLLFQGEIIEGNTELEKQREYDINHLKKVISDTLISDGINKMIIDGRLLKRLE